MHDIDRKQFVSKIFGRWLKPLFTLGLKRPIEDNDLYKVHPTMQSDDNTEKFSKHWEKETKRRKPNILRAMCHFNGYEVITVGFLYSIFDTMSRYVNLTYIYYLIPKTKTFMQSTTNILFK